VLEPAVRARNRAWDFPFQGAEAEIVIYHHLGLGDHIICMGLVLELVDRFGCQVHLACKRAYYATVMALYNRSPQVTVFPIEDRWAEREVYAYARQRRLKVGRIG
jgi:hypothetical protein